MIDIEQYPLEYIHECGRPSFYITCKPIEGQILHYEDCIYPDGTKILPGEQLLCLYCGRYLELRTENVRPRS